MYFSKKYSESKKELPTIGREPKLYFSTVAFSTKLLSFPYNSRMLYDSLIFRIVFPLERPAATFAKASFFTPITGMPFLFSENAADDVRFGLLFTGCNLQCPVLAGFEDGKPDPARPNRTKVRCSPGRSDLVAVRYCPVL